MRIEVTLALLAAAVAVAGCDSLLKGSKCNADGTCGGGLVCDQGSQLCVDPIASFADSGMASADAGQGSDAELPDAGEPGTDAAIGADGGAAPDGAGPEPDASLPAGADAEAPGPDAGHQVTLSSPPTRDCLGVDSGWCRAVLPGDGGLADLGTVTFKSIDGTSDTDLWVAGSGGALLTWDGDSWKDRTRQFQVSAADAGFPYADLNAVSVSSYYVFYGGAGPGSARRCGWWYRSSSYVGSAGECSGAEAFAWLGAWDTDLLVGERGHIYTYNGNGLTSDSTGVDYRGVHFFESEYSLVWIVGAGGAVRYMNRAADATKDAVPRGFQPAPSQELYAVRSTGDALFVAGDEALYECDLAAADPAFPNLKSCVNALATGSKKKIRALAGSSRADLFAAGVDESGGRRPLLLRRSGRDSWTEIPLPASLSSGLRSAVRIAGTDGVPQLIVVAGEGGLILSKVEF